MNKSTKVPITFGAAAFIFIVINPENWSPSNRLCVFNSGAK